MNGQRIVTLLTDFGTADAYVASMKGVILALAPRAVLVDASHEVPPQDIRAGAWTLGEYWRAFPQGTIHVAVVDPGVGTDRDALLVVADDHFFLAPDNGLLTWVLKRAGFVKLRKLKPDVHRPGQVSATFHGRDVFAHAAGLLAGEKADIEDVSVETKSVVIPAWASIHFREDRFVGEIVHVDRFGNLITNIGRRQMEEAMGTSCRVDAGPFENIPIYATYGDAPPGELLALFGSADTLELAVSGGSAAKKTGLARGAAVIVRGTGGKAP